MTRYRRDGKVLLMRDVNRNVDIDPRYSEPETDVRCMGCGGWTAIPESWIGTEREDTARCEVCERREHAELRGE